MTTLGKKLTAQEVYDEFMELKQHCSLCDIDYPFSSVEKWGDHSGPVNIHCPNCDGADKIQDVKMLMKMRDLSAIDRRLADKIIECADAGKLKDPHDYKIAMIMKYHFRFKQQIDADIPYGYTERIAMRLIYDWLVAEGHCTAINIYEARAPIPIVWEKKKAVAPTFKGMGTKKKSKKGGKKGSKTQPKLSFGFSKPKKTEGEE